VQLLARNSGRTPNDADQLAAVLNSFAGCFGLQRNLVAYVSTPITTGRRFYDWLAGSGYRDESGEAYRLAHAREVIAVNQTSAHDLVLWVRKVLGKVVIDPTSLEVPDWTQDNYHAFWTRLITDNVGTVVFNDGWEYSTGCAKEFAASLYCGAETLDTKLSHLPPTLALDMLDRAISRLHSEGQPSDRLVGARSEVIEAHRSTTAIDGKHDDRTER
jgi:hypothetical protein